MSNPQLVRCSILSRIVIWFYNLEGYTWFSSTVTQDKLVGRFLDVNFICLAAIKKVMCAKAEISHDYLAAAQGLCCANKRWLTFDEKHNKPFGSLAGQVGSDNLIHWSHLLCWENKSFSRKGRRRRRSGFADSCKVKCLSHVVMVVKLVFWVYFVYK